MKTIEVWLLDLKNTKSIYINENRFEDILKGIKSRFINEQAENLTDEEIKRTLCPCVAGSKLIKAATYLRDNNELTLENYKII